MYSVIVSNRERHSFNTKGEAQAKANEYKYIPAEVAYWVNKDQMPEIVGDNRSAMVDRYLEQG